MQYLLSSTLSAYVRVDATPAHPPHPRTGASVSPIYYGTWSALSELGLVLLLLRFGTTTLYRTGAMMVGADLALGVNVVE